MKPARSAGLGCGPIEGRAGYQYRLPTEAEWEYCYRAGTASEYWSGQTMVCGQSHFGYLFSSIPSTACPGVSATANVGRYSANPWGLHDIEGNVWEWCLDAWDGVTNYAAAGAVDPYETSGPDRVCRGGGFSSSSYFLRAARRSHLLPTGGGLILGFRVVLAPALVP